ncbi:hypothetical protein, partial [Candidatus Ichthyocystis sparus]|uniref:hypothetical protein n=1 Tax=Candidatus Ichthyocystis sparus TaxID=1561004 RepID=UPI00114795D7
MINIGNKHLGQDDDDEAVEFAECYTVVYEKENGSRVSHNGISLLSKLSVLRSAITKLAVLSMADGVGGIFFGNSADDKSSEEDSDEYYDEGSDAHLIAQSWCDLKASICSVIYLESSSGCAHKKNESSDLMGIKESFRHCLSVGHSTNDFSNPILE